MRRFRALCTCIRTVRHQGMEVGAIRLVEAASAPEDGGGEPCFEKNVHGEEKGSAISRGFTGVAEVAWL